MPIDNIKFLGFPKKPELAKMEDLPELAVLEARELATLEHRSYPALLVSGMQEKRAIAVYLAARNDLALPAIRTTIGLVEDMPKTNRDYFIGLVKTKEEEVDLLLHGIKEQTEEAYRSEFVEEQQKKSWLDQRLARPNRGVYTPHTRNRVK